MIRERAPGRWQVVVYAGTDPTTGKERRVRRTVHGGKKRALELERQLLRELGDGHHQAADVTVAELLERWLDLAGPDLSPTTLYTYRRYVDRVIVPELGAVKLQKLSAVRLDAFYGRLRTQPGARGRPVSAQTIKQIHAIIRRALNQALRWRWITSNPAAQATPPRTSAHELELPEAGDVARLLDAAAATDPDFATFLWLAAVTGGRRGELCALRWRDVDLDGASLLIGRALIVVDGTVSEKDTKTHQQRRVALDAATLTVLGAHRARALERVSRCSAALTDDDYVFTTDADGTPMRPDVATGRYRRLAKANDIPGRLHDLRHWHVTQLLGAGVPVRQVAGRVGHASAKMTLDVYGHYSEAGDRAAAGVATKAIEAPR